MVVSDDQNLATGLFLARSTNGGATWTRSVIGTGPSPGDGLPRAESSPSVAFDSYGNCFVAYVGAPPATGDPATGDTAVRVLLSSDGGATFSSLAVLGSNDVDQPTVTTGPGPAGAGSVWVTFADFDYDGTFSGEARMALSGALVTGSGQVGTFSTEFTPFLLDADGFPVEGAFGDVAVGPAGEVAITFQDTAYPEGPADIYLSRDPNGLAPGGLTTPVKVVTTQVGSFDLISPQPNRSVDAAAGLAWDRSSGPHQGRLYLVYTDKKLDVDGFETDDTDVWLTGSDDGGVTWGAAQQVNSDASGMSQFLPRIALDQTTGDVAITWYDCRADAGAGGANDTDGVPNTDVALWGALLSSARPNAPSALSATALSDTAIQLGWTDGSAIETGFQVERSSNGGTTWTLAGATGASSTGTGSFTDTGLTADTLYSYRVRAQNDNGFSAYSNTATARTLKPPASPTGLTATVQAGLQVRLDWKDASTDEAGFKIERQPDAQGNAVFGQIATVGAGVVTYTNTGLAAGTTYVYRVRAYGTGGTSAPSNEATAVIPAVPAPAPSTLAVTALSSTSVQLTWTETASNEDGFKIERKTGTGSFSEIGQAGADATSYTDTAAAAATTYTYQVRAYNLGGSSGYSNAASLTTLAIPGGLTTAPVYLRKVQLAWTDIAGETEYRVERRQGGGSFAQVGTTTANTASYTDADPALAPGSSYIYRVRAKNADGFSSYSAEATAAIPDAPPAPSGAVATATDSTTVRVDWTYTDGTQTGFKVEQSHDDFATLDTTATAAASARSASLGSLAPGTTYQFRVRATNPGGDSAPSNASGITPLGRPTALTVSTVSTTALQLSWTSGSAGLETGFKVERSSSGAYTEVGTTGAGVTTFSNTGLSPDTAYTYRVRAYATRSDSSYSDPASGATLPVPVTGLTATAVNSGQIDLTWTDAVSTETGFKVERAPEVSPGVAGTYAQVGTAAAVSGTGGTGSYSDTAGLTANTTYYYQVRSTNAGGDSAPSQPSSVILLAAPSGLALTSADSAQISLSWTDNSTGETGFKVERSTGGAYAQVGTPAGTTYTDTGLSAGTSYTYRVRAYATRSDSSYSGTATLAPLAAPSGLSVTPTAATSLQLTWSYNGTGHSGFRIERQSGGAFAEIGTAGAAARSYTDSGLAVETAYTYRVRAYTSGSFSSYSGTATGTTAPDAPASLVVTAISSAQINLAWTDASQVESGFKIERAPEVSPGVAGAYAQIGTAAALSGTGGAGAYTDTAGLTTNNTYYYRVRATDAAGDSSPSASSSVLLLAAPGGLALTGLDSARISLSWTDNSTGEAGFKIERSTAGGAYSQVGTSTGVAYTDTGLSAGVAYSNRVRAYATRSDSSYSGAASLTLLPAPTGLAVTAQQSALDLAWSYTDAGQTGFKVERKSGAGAFSQVATVGASARSYTDADPALAVGTTYTYRVRAYAASSDSSYSGTADGVMRPAAPTALEAVGLDSTHVKLTWTKVGTPDGYKVERSTNFGTTYAQIGSTAATVGTYTDDTVTADAELLYRVRAYNASGNSDPSDPARVEVLAAPVMTGVTTLSTSSLQVTWANQTSYAEAFRVERSSDGGITYPTSATVTVSVDPGQPVSYTATGLAPDTLYTFRVRARSTNLSGSDSSYSGTASGRTLPAAPSGLAAEAQAGRQVLLSWSDTSSSETSFEIQRKTGAAASTNPWEDLATAAANASSYTDTPAADGTYTYRVRAVTPQGASAWSNTATATPMTAPSGLVATAPDSATVHLVWTDNSAGESGYEIERKIEAGAYALLATTAASATTYDDATVTAGTLYTYRVRGTNATGVSGYSNADSVKPLAAPSGLTATVVSSSRVDLAWTDNSAGETGFRIERAPDVSGAAGTYAQIATATAAAYSSTGLAEYTTYYFRVRAYDGSGNSSYSGSASARTQLGAPTGLTAATLSTTQVALAWTDGSGNEDGFKIERAPEVSGAAGTYAQIGTTGASATAYTSTGLSANTTYYFRVRAYKGTENSAYSNADSATTGPVAPTGLTATASSGTQVDLAWTDASDNESGFKIERSDDAGAFSQVAAPAANAITYSNTGLLANHTYTYRVRAWNASGNSGYSNTDSATTMGAPTGLTATATNATTISLAWTDGSNTENGFRIERAPETSAGSNVAGTYAQIATVGVNATTYDSTGLTANTTYFYKVRAYNSAGNSGYSNSDSATTMSAPSGLTATAATATSVNLAWTDNTGRESGFKIERAPEVNGAAGTYAQVGTTNANVTTYSSTGLTADATYYFKVRAYNATGNSAYSTVDSATTMAAPSGLTVVAYHSTRVDLAWTDNTTREAGYKIERSADMGATYTQIVQLGPNVQAYSDTTVTADTPYVYQVRAYNATGNSAYSSTDSATTMAAPTGLTATVLSSSQIRLNWADASSKETGYKVERAPETSPGSGVAGTYTQVGTVGASATTYTSTGLSAGTRYYFQVRAYNATGNSSYSSAVNAATSP